MEQMQDGLTNCECGNTLKIKEFTEVIFEYCDVCFYHKSINKECLHENKIPVKLKIANGSYQVRLYCEVCKILDPKPQKQTNYDLSKLKESSLENYYNFRNELLKTEKPELNEFIKYLNSNKQQTIKDIYETYIKSNEWKEKRKLILVRDQDKCQICGKKAENIHHLTYAHLQKEYLFELVSLCHDCHLNEYHKNKNVNDPDSFDNQANPF